jgi:peroxiredoxin
MTRFHERIIGASAIVLLGAIAGVVADEGSHDEDFWYRGSGWCIRAMPQVKALAEEFKGQPVAVLGMKTDHDEKDAKFVVDELSLNYPVLKAEGVPEKYSVRDFPTLIIVDQDGRVADIHVGYSPTLRAEVTKSVQKLLGRN